MDERFNHGFVWYLIVSIPDLCTITYFSFEIFDHGFDGLDKRFNDGFDMFARRFNDGFDKRFNDGLMYLI